MKMDIKYIRVYPAGCMRAANMSMENPLDSKFDYR